MDFIFNNQRPICLKSAQEGAIFLINKPYGWSSYDVLRKLKPLLQVEKMGHAGTLDPLASGLLIVATGNKTKLLSTFQQCTKTYQGAFLLGTTTASYDLETPFQEQYSYHHLTAACVAAAMNQFKGFIEQVPPIYSALKQGGKRLYKKARKNQLAELAPRPVHIETFELTTYDKPYVHFRVTCGKGTYIRSLARDLGQRLEVGACLASLQRVAIGDFLLSDAYSFEEGLPLYH